MKNTYDKKILVTGGAGFLGSFLCERLIDENNYDICMDNFYTGQINNVKHLTNHPYFQLVTHDVIIPFIMRLTKYIILHVHIPGSLSI